jgi:hypothetical protein
MVVMAITMVWIKEQPVLCNYKARGSPKLVLPEIINVCDPVVECNRAAVRSYVCM